MYRTTICNFGLAIGIYCLAHVDGASATEMARRLGYDDNTKLLIIHADDIGMSHAVNHASIEAFKAGIVTSGSVMAPCPWFPEIAAYCRENPDVDIGLHLTLTCEWKSYRWGPVASPEQAPGLIDPQGYLWHSVSQVVEHATPAEVEIELRAQIERALKFGIQPTHIDMHMGVLAATPEFFEIYIRLGKEYGLPPMVIHPTRLVKFMLKAAGIQLPDSLLEEVRASGLPMLDVLNTGQHGDDYESRKAAYYQALRHLQPGVTQIIVHLGTNDQELRHITSSWDRRYDEFRIFTDPDTRRLIEALSIQLIGWREMKALMPRNEQMSK